MPNSSGKSLLFNGLANFLSFDKEPFIKDTDKDLWLEVEFQIDTENYRYLSDYNNRYKIYNEDNSELKDFDLVLKKYMWPNIDKLEYYGRNKSSLHSINRFFFFNSEWIKDEETTNKIDFIDSRFDGPSKRLLLANVLWANIDPGFFWLITEVEHKEEFVRRNSKKFEKNSDEIQKSLADNSDLQKHYDELQEIRIITGDIVIAIRELEKLINKHKVLYWVSNKDHIFLQDQLYILKSQKDVFQSKISNIRQTIKLLKVSGKDEFWFWNTLILRSKDVILYEQYRQYKFDLEKINRMAIDEYISNNIDPFLSDFKSSLRDLYNLFTEKAIYYWLLEKSNVLMDKDNINFDANLLQIEAYFKTSEWTRKTIRILTCMALQIFSKLWIHYSFYDACLENIDEKHRVALFETFIEYIKTKGIPAKNMIFFVTKVDSSNTKGLLMDLELRYSDYINIIEKEGLSEII